MAVSRITITVPVPSIGNCKFSSLNLSSFQADDVEKRPWESASEIPFGGICEVLLLLTSLDNDGPELKAYNVVYDSSHKCRNVITGAEIPITKWYLYV